MGVMAGECGKGLWGLTFCALAAISLLDLLAALGMALGLLAPASLSRGAGGGGGTETPFAGAFPCRMLVLAGGFGGAGGAAGGLAVGLGGGGGALGGGFAVEISCFLISLLSAAAPGSDADWALLCATEVAPSADEQALLQSAAAPGSEAAWVLLSAAKVAPSIDELALLLSAAAPGTEAGCLLAAPSSCAGAGKLSCSSQRRPCLTLLAACLQASISV